MSQQEYFLLHGKVPYKFSFEKKIHKEMANVGSTETKLLQYKWLFYLNNITIINQTKTHTVVCLYLVV